MRPLCAYAKGEIQTNPIFLRGTTFRASIRELRWACISTGNRKSAPCRSTWWDAFRDRIDDGRGVQGDLRLTAGIFAKGSFAAGVFAQGTWANASSNSTFYGNTPQQSTATGFPAFNAGSGLLFTSFGLLWSLELARDWVAVGNLESRYLRGDAASSPLVERASNYYATVGIAHRF